MRASALLERLVSIESVNPTLVQGGAGEAEIGRFVAAWLEEHGVETEYHELAPRRANVVGRVAGSGGGRTLMLNAHLDTVGLGGPDGGLVPRIDGDRMYGRGAYDMKGAAAAMMLAPMQLGSKVVYLARFSAVGVLNAIRVHRVSILMGVHSMYGAMLRLMDAMTDDF